MGSTVEAKCKCGYRATSDVGGGKSNYLTFGSMPALCEHCQTLVTVNKYAKPPQCPKCKSPQVVPYDDPALNAKSDTTITESGRVWEAMAGSAYLLTCGTYLCPACKQYTLRFIETCLWD
jgi:hypothetical protein